MVWISLYLFWGELSFSLFYRPWQGKGFLIFLWQLLGPVELSEETKHLLTNANSSTYTKKILLVRQNSPTKKTIFLARCLYTLYKQKLSDLRPLLAFTFPKGFRKSKKLGHWTSRSGGKKTFKMCEQIKIYPWKTCNRRGDFSPLEAKVSNLRPLLSITFPQGFQKI